MYTHTHYSYHETNKLIVDYFTCEPFCIIPILLEKQYCILIVMECVLWPERFVIGQYYQFEVLNKH